MYKVLPKTRRWTPADAVTGNIYVENGEVKNSRAGSIVRQMESARIDPGVFCLWNIRESPFSASSTRRILSDRHRAIGPWMVIGVGAGEFVNWRTGRGRQC
jgi:hypothetical protein